MSDFSALGGSLQDISMAFCYQEVKEVRALMNLLTPVIPLC